MAVARAVARPLARPFDVCGSDADARYDLVLARCEQHGGRPHRYKRWAKAHCPLHGDTQASIGITHPDRSKTSKVLVHCFVCGKGATARILAAWGLTFADLACVRSDRRPSRPRIVAHYDYLGEDGVSLVARRTRMAGPKSFFWETPDPTSASGWRRSQGGFSEEMTPALYCNGAVPHGAERVFIVEGEKSVDRLTQHGLAAVCAPFGATKWYPEWTALVMATGCAEVVIVADNDKPGRVFARRVEKMFRAARTALRCDICLKLVTRLPDIGYGDDVFDYLDRHAVADLLALVAVTPDEGARLRCKHAEAQRRYALKLKESSSTETERDSPSTSISSLPKLSAVSFSSASANLSAPVRATADASRGNRGEAMTKSWMERMAEDPTLRAFVEAEIARAGLEVDTLRYQRDHHKRCHEELAERLKAVRP